MELWISGLLKGLARRVAMTVPKFVFALGVLRETGARTYQDPKCAAVEAADLSDRRHNARLIVALMNVRLTLMSPSTPIHVFRLAQGCLEFVSEPCSPSDQFVFAGVA